MIIYFYKVLIHNVLTSNSCSKCESLSGRSGRYDQTQKFLHKIFCFTEAFGENRRLPFETKAKNPYLENYINI